LTYRNSCRRSTTRQNKWLVLRYLTNFIANHSNARRSQRKVFPKHHVLLNLLVDFNHSPVLGESSRSFNSLLPHSQSLLKNIFGFELVDISEVTKSSQADQDADDNDSKGKKKKSTVSKGYILRNCLDQEVITEATELFDVKIGTETFELKVLDFSNDETSGTDLDAIKMLILGLILIKNRRTSQGMMSH
jgi:hypothetical protein